MKKLILTIFCMVLLVGMVSASWEWDNRGDYNETTKTIKIKNALGFGEDIANIILNTPQIVNVIRGEDRKVAEFTINNIKKYKDVFNEMNFYNIREGMKEFERDFTYKYKSSLGKFDVNDYEYVCIEKEFANKTKYEDCYNEITGTHKEERFEWVELDTSKELPKGKITIGIFTDVPAGDNVEWIPTLFGVEIDEWAAWTESLDVGLVAYYNFDESSGLTLPDVFSGNFDGDLINMESGDWVTGKIGNALDFDGINDHVNVTSSGSFDNLGTDNVTYCFWMNTTTKDNSGYSLSKRGGDVYPLYAATGRSDTGYMAVGLSGVDLYQTPPVVTDGEWHFICVVRDTALDKLILYIDGSHVENKTDPTVADLSNSISLMIGGTSVQGNYYTDLLDELGIWNRTLTSTEITQLYNGGTGITRTVDVSPIVTLNTPVEMFNSTSPTIDFNCSASDDIAIVNVSLLINGTIEQTNSSGMNGTNYLFTETITTGVGYYNWTCTAFDSANQSTTATTRNFTYINDLTVSIDYPVVEFNSSLQEISFNGSASDDTAIINVSLYTDGKLNQTNSSGLNNTEYNFTQNFTDGTHNWTFEACDVISCVSATTRNFTINTTPDIHFTSPTLVNNTNSTSSSVPVNVTLTETFFSNVTFNFYNGSVTSFFFSNSTRFINVSLEDDSYGYNVTIWTSTGQQNSTVTRNITIDTTAPDVNITFPTALVNYYSINTNETLNWTALNDNLDKCWYNYNFTNVTITCNINTTNFTLTSQRNITLYSNDTFGNEDSDFQEWAYKVFENYHIYDNETYEMDSEIFSINVSSDGSEIILGSLVYNGTSYLATKIGTNYVMEFNRTITLNQTGNVSFYWSFNYGGEIINSSTFYQNVSEILMGICGGTLTTQTINFTAYDEEDLARITPYDFYGTFEYWTGDGSISKTFSISNASVDNVTICINVNETFYANAKIQYENTSFVKRNYYLINETITNSSSQNVSLFLLNTSISTSFIIEVKDEFQISIPNAYVHIQRYYPGIDQYETVEMAFTDNTGSTIGHFEAETEDYRLIFEKDGVIIYQSGTQKIFCRESPCTITFQTEAGAGITWEDFGVISDFDWTLEYDETTEVWAFTYTDTSGSIGSGRLYVYYEDPAEGKITICNTSSSLLADTLTCDVTGYNGTIYATTYLSRSPEILVSLKSIFKKIAEGIREVLGLEGLFLSMFVLLSLALTGLWNPAVGVILVAVGMLVLNLMGLASFGATTLWSVIFIALILLWKLKT